MITNLDKVDVPLKLVKELDYIFSYFGEIEKVILFGSRARRDNKENSDIDLAIYCDGDLSLFIEEVENTTHTLLEFDFSAFSSL